MRRTGRRYLWWLVAAMAGWVAVWVAGCSRDGGGVTGDLGTGGDTADVVGTVDAPLAEDVPADTGPTEDVPPSTVDAGDATDTSEDDAGSAPQTPFPWAAESTDPTCDNGLDDDGGGYTDCDDFSCSRNIAVSVCGHQARYEGAANRCGNDGDDDGDGLVDCDDPDCEKNPFHDACPALVPEQDCAGDTDTDGDGLAGCDDTDCVLARAPACAGDERVRVLFDQTLDETAAAGPNSDWVVDVAGRFPWPSDPASADDWDGALSGFGYALWESGDYLVENLASWDGALTWEDDDNPQDLTHYDVLVLFEPSRQMTAAEKEAVLRFVSAGRGLLLVANHDDSDRDGNGFSAPRVFNDLFGDNPLGADPFGFAFDAVDLDNGAPMDRVVAPAHPVIDGPAGQVARIGFYWGCTAHLTGTKPGAIALIQTTDAADDTTGIVAGAIPLDGGGRVVFVTDSAIGGDGSDSHGNRDPGKDTWNNGSQDNRAFFLNAIAWLAGAGETAR